MSRMQTLWLWLTTQRSLTLLLSTCSHISRWVVSYIKKHNRLSSVHEVGNLMYGHGARGMPGLRCGPMAFHAMAACHAM